MADGVTVTGLVDLRKTLKELFDLPEKEQKAILRAVAKEAAPEILKDHYDRNSGSWAEPDPAYAKSKDKRGKPQLVKTGEMMQAIESRRPHPCRKIRIAKSKKKPNTYRIAIALRKMVDGKNVYAMAQNGRASHAVQQGTGKKVSLKALGVENARLSEAHAALRKAGRTKMSYKAFQAANSKFGKVDVARSKQRMVCRNEAGDESYFTKRLEDAYKEYLRKKAKRAKRTRRPRNK